MKREEIFNAIKGGLIISCQAQPNEPLHSSFIMGKMALASELAGATGIRADTVADIKEIRSNTNLPIIGIVKKDFEDSKVFITPTISEVRELANEGVEIIAMDATFNSRPNNESLGEIVKQIRIEYPEQLLMADCSSYEDAINAEKLGFDFIGTTLFGTADDGWTGKIIENDFALIKKLLNDLSTPLIVEGHINTPELAKQVQELKPHSMVIGSAITRPMWIAKTFINKIKEVNNE